MLELGRAGAKTCVYRLAQCASRTHANPCDTVVEFLPLFIRETERLTMAGQHLLALIFQKDKIMNICCFSGVSARTYAFIATMLLFASISPAFGQERSQDRDNPTLIEGKEITDKLDGRGAEYFYQFTMGPGKLSLSFRVTASDTNAGATLDLFDASSSSPILSNVLVQGVDGGSEHVIKSVQLAKKRNVIIMRIKGIRYGDSGGTGVYSVGIEGTAPKLDEKSAAKPASANRLTGELDGTDESHSYTLTITGPGKVTLIFDVKASGTNAGAYFDLLDGKGRAILSDVLVQGVDSGSERISKSVNFIKPQVLTLRVKGIRYGSSGGNGVYSVQIDGPVAPVSPDK